MSFKVGDTVTEFSKSNLQEGVLDMRVLFYPACADRRPIDRNYIRKGCVFTCFEDALSCEKKFFHDDDDWGVIGRVDDIWFRVWQRSEKGKLLVSDDTGLKSGRINALPLEEYLCFKKNQHYCD